MPEAFAFREITGEDIEDVATLVADAFTGYREFAPAGWQPPTASESGLRRPATRSISVMAYP